MSNPLKKTMVYLGLAEEEFNTEERSQERAPIRQQSSRSTVQNSPAEVNRAAVTPLRKPAAVRNESPQEMNEIITVHPRQYSDAQPIAEAFRDGIPVIINLSQMSELDARRLIDFASGLSQGLLGKIERVTPKVFLLSPAHIVISNEAGMNDTDSDPSFFNQD